MAFEPRAGDEVILPCRFCKRDPRPGEKFGTEPEAWDFTGICPECWDEKIAEPDDDEEDPLAEEEEALERDAVEETFGEDGALYEEMTGKTLGDK